MKKYLLSLLMASILSSTIQAYDTATLTTYPKAAASHVFSTNGVKDIAVAYGAIMLITLVHEIGHSVVAKLLCGVPIDIVIGGKRSGKESFLKKYTGIEFTGFNPLESDARWEEHHKEDIEIYQPTLAGDTAVLLAGPIAQAVTCYCIYKCLKNTDGFYITKAVGIGGIVDTIIGVNGLYGARQLKWADSYKIMENIKKYFRPTPQVSS